MTHLYIRQTLEVASLSALTTTPGVNPGFIAWVAGYGRYTAVPAGTYVVDGLHVLNGYLGSVQWADDTVIIDGYHLSFVYNPVNYTAPIDNILGEHLAMIDKEIGDIIAGTIDGYSLSFVYSPVNYIAPIHSILGEHISQIDQQLNATILHTRLLGVGTDIHEPSGFTEANRAASTISYDDGTRTFSIAPVSGSYSFWANGTLFTKTSTDSVVWPNINGIHYFYFDQFGVIQTTTDPSIVESVYQGLGTNLATVYWDADHLVTNLFAEDRHGFMPQDVQLPWHLILGIQWASGGAFGNIVLGDGSLAAHAQFGVADSRIVDEDIIFWINNGAPQTISPIIQAPVFYRSGSDGYWRNKTADGYPFIQSGTAGYTGPSGRMAYNHWNGSSWVLSEVGQDEFVIVFIAATSSPITPLVSILGQNTYTAASDARSAISLEAQQITDPSITFCELTILGAVIYQTNSAYTNSVKARLVAVDYTGSGWVDLRGIRSGSSSGGGGGGLSDTPPVDVTKSTALAGTSAFAARADHKHDIATTTASSLSVGGSSTEGSSTSLARADHTHGLPAFGTTAGTFAQGNDSRFSDARTPLAHASTHISGGSDVIDGYHVSLVYSPTNYLAPIDNVVGEHVYRIDSKLGIVDSRLGTLDSEFASLHLDGYVTGPASATDTAIARYNGTTGKLIQNSSATIDGSGNITAGTYNGVIVATHHTRHESGGADQIDGYQVAITYSPVNYTTPIDNKVGEHIYQIDQKLGDLTNSIGNVHLDGYVVGPASSTDTAIARYNGTTGRLIQNSSATIDGSGNITAGTYNGVTVATHHTRHESGGDDQIDGYNVYVLYSPTNYAISANLVGQHLRGIDNKLGTVVVGPSSATDTAIARYNGTTGKLIQNSSATIDGSGNITAGTYNGVTVASHHTRHENGGADQIDGYNVAISYTPTNYLTPSPAVIGQHFYRIDQQLGILNNAGYVVGPASSTDTAIARYNGTTGKLIQDSSITIDGSGNLTLSSGNIVMSSPSATVDGVDVSSHHTRHESAGADQIDGYKVVINYTPSNYPYPGGTPNNIIGQHIYRIDQEFGILIAAHSTFIVGPASSTDSAVVLYNGTTGKLAKNSTVTIDGSGNITAGTYNGVTVASHHTRHENGGADQIDGYQVAIAYTPTNYTNPSPAVIGQHFYRIDQKLANVSNFVVGPGSATDSAIALYNGTTGKVIKNSAATMDGYGNITAGTYNGVTVASHHTRHESGGSDQIDGYNLAITYTPVNYTSPVHALIGEHIARIDGQLHKKTVIVEFALTEDINNTTEYFFTWRSTGGDTATGKRSSTSTGMQNNNSCNPFQVPFNATIVKALLCVRGVGVNNGSVTYPVSYQTNLMSVGFTSDSSLGSVNFSISNSFTVGTYSVGNTNFKGSTTLSVSVNEGDMLGLKFVNGSGASTAGQTRMAFVTLILEAR